MASKSKKRTKRPTSAGLLAQARRSLEKGQHKQALKDAKVLFRQSPTAEHRGFLEFAYIGRAEELQRQGNRSACRGVIESLLELGVQEPAVQTALPKVAMWAGLLDRLPDDLLPDSAEFRADWEATIADQAVLSPDVASSRPEIAAKARLIRNSLDCLEAGDSDQAISQLKNISRSSPFAEWKYFVRGLDAYYARRRTRWWPTGHALRKTELQFASLESYPWWPAKRHPTMSGLTGIRC